MTAWQRNWGTFSCLYLREMLRLGRERMRWAGAFAQPLLFWFIIGSGMAESFRIQGAEGVSALQYFFPGILVMIVLFTSIFTTISVVEDRQQGFLQGVLAGPGSRLALVLGKVCGVTTLVFIQVGVFVLMAPLIDLPLAEIAWARLVLVVLLASVGLTAMNFTLAWVLDSVQSYHAVMSVVLIPTWFLSGALFPPPHSWLRNIMILNPVTHAVDGVRASLDPTALGVIGVLGPVAGSLIALSVYCIAMLALASWTCRRRAA